MLKTPLCSIEKWPLSTKRALYSRTLNVAKAWKIKVLRNIYNIYAYKHLSIYLSTYISTKVAIKNKYVAIKKRLQKLLLKKKY